MRCDRCGDTLEKFELAGASTVVCNGCGFVDVPVDHEPEPRPNESWQDAFERFYDRFGTAEDVPAEADAPVAAPEPATEPTALTDLEGVGPAVAERLAASGFESVTDLAAAGPEDLAAIEGVGPKLAARLIAQFDADTSPAQ